MLTSTSISKFFRKFGIALFLASLLPSSFGAGYMECLIGTQVYHLKIADTAEEIRHGLMERTALANDCGMLFDLRANPGYHRFWMKNTKIPLDLIFINQSGIVTDVYTMKVEAPRREHESPDDYENRLPLYPSSQPVMFAIELPAGSAKNANLQVGAEIPDMPILQ